jgi:hypothetical protein
MTLNLQINGTPWNFQQPPWYLKQNWIARPHNSFICWYNPLLVYRTHPLSHYYEQLPYLLYFTTQIMYNTICICGTLLVIYCLILRKQVRFFAYFVLFCVLIEYEKDSFCYHAVQNLLSSRLLSRNVKIKIYKTIILPVVLYGCETLSLT